MTDICYGQIHIDKDRISVCLLFLIKASNRIGELKAVDFNSLSQSILGREGHLRFALEMVPRTSQRQGSPLPE